MDIGRKIKRGQREQEMAISAGQTILIDTAELI
jgi:hypothetical protein